MKKSLVFACLSLVLTLGLPRLRAESAPAQEPPTLPVAALAAAALPPGAPPADEPSPEPEEAPAPAEPRLTVLLPDGSAEDMDGGEYLVGVLAAEMPASFEPEALKAQAVAARTYALYSAAAGKHGAAQVCTDFACCQAWISEAQRQANWGESFEANERKLREAVEATAGQVLRYEGEPVFAAFHSSSAGATEDCGAVWNPRPYLVSVPSPETAADVPDYISFVQLRPLDFRDTVLSAHPEADFSGEPETWLGERETDASGRVAALSLGGVRLTGTELRSLFSLRSTAFQLSLNEGVFVFTVTGHGHGVGMSQYGAQVMAENGADYREILAHYYPGTTLGE